MNHTSDRKKVSRRAFVATLGAGGLGVAAAKAMKGDLLAQGGQIVLENERVRLTFSVTTGFLAGIENKKSKEVIAIEEDSFEVLAEEFKLTPGSLPLKSVRARSATSCNCVWNSHASKLRPSEARPANPSRKCWSR